MTHKHKNTFYPVPPVKSKGRQPVYRPTAQDTYVQGARPKLEIVLKCDSTGSLEALSASILKIAPPEVDIHIIHSGIGDIHKSDILIAETGSRLIVGFQVDVPSGVDRELAGHSVEARIYDVIYKLTDDLHGIAEGLIPGVSQEETIIGSSKVIALFKSSRKGIIIGCEILDGFLAVGQRFRIISAMGPVYSGTIESMHIEKNAVQKATGGQKVGIKIRDFNKVKVGDIVESFCPSPVKKTPAWQPRGGVIRLRSAAAL